MYSSYIPDFGFDEVIDFEERKGWRLIAEVISRYPRSQLVVKRVKEMLYEKKKAEERRKVL